MLCAPHILPRVQLRVKLHLPRRLGRDSLELDVRARVQVHLAVGAALDLPHVQDRLGVDQPVGLTRFGPGPGRDEEGAGDGDVVGAGDAEGYFSVRLCFQVLGVK